VFEAMLQNAVRICDAKFSNLALFENDGFRFVAQHGAPPKYRDVRQRGPFIRGKARGNLGRVIKTKQVDHVADVAAEEPTYFLAKIKVWLWPKSNCLTKTIRLNCRRGLVLKLPGRIGTTTVH